MAKKTAPTPSIDTLFKRIRELETRLELVETRQLAPPDPVCSRFAELCEDMGILVDDDKVEDDTPVFCSDGTNLFNIISAPYYSEGEEAVILDIKLRT